MRHIVATGSVNRRSGGAGRGLALHWQATSAQPRWSPAFAHAHCPCRRKQAQLRRCAGWWQGQAGNPQCEALAAAATCRGMELPLSLSVLRHNHEYREDVWPTISEPLKRTGGHVPLSDEMLDAIAVVTRCDDTTCNGKHT